VNAFGDSHAEGRDKKIGGRTAALRCGREERKRGVGIKAPPGIPPGAGKNPDTGHTGKEPR